MAFTSYGNIQKHIQIHSGDKLFKGNFTLSDILRNIFQCTVEVNHISVKSVPRSLPQMLESCTHSHGAEYTVEINHISVNSVPRSLPQMLESCTYSHGAEYTIVMYSLRISASLIRTNFLEWPAHRRPVACGI